MQPVQHKKSPQPFNADRKAYHDALRRLPIASPTFEDIQAVLPHLPAKQVGDILQRAKQEGQSDYYPAPPLRVKNSFHSINIGTYKGQTTLEHAFAQRTVTSYADKKWHGDIPHVPNDMEKEAMRYAASRWSASLVEDNWTDFLNLHLIDPEVVTSRGLPEYSGTIFATLKRDFNQVMNDHSLDSQFSNQRLTSGQKEAMRLEGYLAEYTTDAFIGDELKGGRGGFSDWNCARCGGGMSLSACTGCGVKVKDDGFRSGWGTPLPPSLFSLGVEANIIRGSSAQNETLEHS